MGTVPQIYLNQANGAGWELGSDQIACAVCATFVIVDGQGQPVGFQTEIAPMHFRRTRIVFNIDIYESMQSDLVF